MTQRLQDWVTLQAERRPDGCAIVLGRHRITYGELEEESNRLARALKVAGCKRGDRVALLLPKSIEALVAMFAALKADCIYVPLDPTSPAARLAQILHICESRCLLAVESTAARLKDIGEDDILLEFPRIGWMDDGSNLDCAMETEFSRDDVRRLSGSAVDSLNSDSDPAHILFTSGSTGVPKGVVITHSNVIHFVDWAIRTFGIDPSDRISGHAPLYFDLSTFDIYGSVAAGAQLHLVPPELSLLPHRLAAFIRESALTQWFSVPSVLNHMAKCDVVGWNDFPALERLLWCGEKFPTPALIYWMRRLPKVSFVNLYGPTETTIASSYYRVPCCPEDDVAEIPIGGPCEGEQLLVLDEQHRPVAPGEVGDLYIAGLGLSPGYWRDPKKTEEVFLTSPYGSDPSDRIYKTGDLARIGSDRLIYLVGRSDSQIKSRGYRIELGEIETAVHAVPGVQEAAVVALDTTGFEGTAICCAYVPLAGSALSPLTLKKHLAGVLPHYMLPVHWMVLDWMPLNGNGKADRRWVKQRFCEPASLAAQEAGRERQVLRTRVTKSDTPAIQA
ncbi:MAG: D-alanine--poly(phosphoribitol) ligase [Acidobacteria bacterium]|nr:MAG: D-alanine--poly(phosphoribitol) ligase [Acidobacteriota bacterium]